MEKEKINAIDDIMQKISSPIDGYGKYSFMAGYPTKNTPTSDINDAYLAEIETYKKEPVLPCSKSTSLKLLKKFRRQGFHTFWSSSVKEYLPAVSEGTMKLCEVYYPHDEAMRYAKKIISDLSPQELAKDFLYGVAHNAPEYRTALASYYYIKNLPDHEFEKKYIGSGIARDGKWKDYYHDIECEICNYMHANNSFSKNQFYDANLTMSCFYLSARKRRCNLNEAIIYLEEYKTLPRPSYSINDYEYFMKIISVIENSPENTTSGKLRKILKDSKMLSMNQEQIEAFVDMLGYLDILHSDDSRGMIFTHTKERERLTPLSERTFAEHPVNRWTRKCGIDYKSIAFLFEGIY